MDSRQKKILILHASAGHGHWKAAQALEEICRRDYSDHAVELLDTLDFLPPGFKKSYAGSYLFMIKRMPWLWKWVYELSDILVRLPAVRWLRSLWNARIAVSLVRKVLADEPAVVFTTHFMPTEIMARLKRQKHSLHAVAVITDFMVHRFWVFPEIDAYAVAAPATKASLKKMGVASERLHVTGIPVGRRFVTPMNRAELRRRYGVNADNPVVLFTSGGAGAVLSEADIGRLLKAQSEIQILVVCGHNRALYDTICVLERRYAQIKPFEFVDTMHELMEIADVIVGKAGGLTVSEALVKNRCFVVMDPVPGQETHNAEALEAEGAGRWVRQAADLVPTIESLLAHQKERAAILKGAERIRKPQAAEDIVRLGMALIRARS